MIAKESDNRISIIITALYLAFTFGIFAPVEIYFVNINEIWFDIYDLLPGVLTIFAFLFLFFFLLFIVLNRFNQSVEKITRIVFIIAGLSLYIQGNFLQADYDKIGTEMINWSQYTTEGILNTVGWIGILMLFFALLYKLGIEAFLKLGKFTMIFILLIQSVTLITVAIMQHGMLHKNDYTCTTEDEWNLSKESNYIVLVLDTYDSRIFDELLNTEQGVKYQSILNDFTFYRNTMTVFTLTDFSIPQILTGHKYLNQEDFGPYINKAYANSPFLNELNKNEYDINIYTTVFLPQNKVAKNISNWHVVDSISSNYPRMFLMYYKLILFRYLPHYLKPPFELNLDEFDDLEVTGTIDGHKYVSGVDPNTYSYGNVEFIEGIPEIRAVDSQKDFRFYHIKGIHHTRDLDRNLNEVDDLGEDGTGVSLEESARANMKIIDLFLNKLKSEELYDNSVIVIMADHGAASYEGGGQMQSPLLLVKGYNEKHGFTVSEAPVSYEDLQEAFINLLNGKTGDHVFSVKEGDERTRAMYYTGFIGQRKHFTRNEPFIEYQSTGHAYDLRTLKRTGNEY